MAVSEQIRRIELDEEFRVCPSCGYERGFHSSFLRAGESHKIILICPNCGARYDVGWMMGDEIKAQSSLTEWRDDFKHG